MQSLLPNIFLFQTFRLFPDQLSSNPEENYYHHALQLRYLCSVQLSCERFSTPWNYKSLLFSIHEKSRGTE